MTKPQFDGIGDFSEGIAQVQKDRKWGFIDKTGKVIVVPQFDEVEDFQNGSAIVHRFSEPFRINTRGQLIVDDVAEQGQRQ